MSVTLEQEAIVLSGSCGAEEAETLLALIQANRGKAVDVSGVEWAHTAMWQVLIAFRPPIKGAPSHEFIRQWLLPLFTNDKPDTTAT